ncbi:MAG: hypothetical protein JWQ30_935 [Sediminibacterium sp.]|nr:hypothetical protein [Sediminibacterium sp.]
MTQLKNLGIWMDHASAHLMEYSTESNETKIIESAFTHEEKADTLGNSEYGMHNKEQHQTSAFYKKLGDSIKEYDAVILFGPTDAKLELFNLLKADHHFDKINIEVKASGKMTENQQHAFVRDHFTQN